jgi:hypothetical protein
MPTQDPRLTRASVTSLVREGMLRVVGELSPLHVSCSLLTKQGSLGHQHLSIWLSRYYHCSHHHYLNHHLNRRYYARLDISSQRLDLRPMRYRLRATRLEWSKLPRPDPHHQQMLDLLRRQRVHYRWCPSWSGMLVWKQSTQWPRKEGRRVGMSDSLWWGWD